MAFKEDLKIKSAYIEDLLKQYMPKEEGYQKNYKFYEGMCNCCGNHSTE